MIGAMVGLNATVKGLAGPTTAIMQMQAIVGIGLNAVFLGVIPTFYQICGAIIALLGALSIILSNPPAAPKK
jgi:drug/metabolite transporter (DMT)-like permease